MKADFLKRVLTESGLSRVSGYGDIIKAVCPFHSGSAGKTFWMHVESARWGCWSTRCPAHSGGNLGDLLRNVGLPPQRVENTCKSFRSFTSNDNTVSSLNLKVNVAAQGDNPSSLKDLDDSGLLREGHVIGWRVNWRDNCIKSKFAAALDFAVSRGISPETLQFFNIGFDSNLNSLIFNLRLPDSGKLVGIARRKPVQGDRYFFSASPVGYKDPAYKYHRVPKGAVLWGFWEQASYIDSGVPIVVVEGFFDVLKLRELGICAVAKMGAKLTNNQAQILERLSNPIILWGDNDSAGILGVGEDVVKLLACPTLTCVLPEGTDPGETGVDTVGRLLSTTVSGAEFLQRTSEFLRLAY